MQTKLITILIACSMAFAQSDIKILVGGITSSTIAGDFVDDLDDAGADVESITGLRLGVEKTRADGLIMGVTYTERGFTTNMEQMDYKMEVTMKINYLTGYLQKSVYQVSPQMDVVAGAELGYFLGANTEICFQGECDDEDLDGDDWDDADNNMLDYGFVIGGRYQISELMSVIGTYYLGLAEIGDDADANNRSFQITLGYVF